MHAADIMTRHVVSVAEDATLGEAIRLMLRKAVSGLPVVDREARPVGVVTEGDLLRRVELGTERQRPRWVEFFRGPGRRAGEYVRTHTRRVADVMSRDPVAVGGDTPLEEVVSLMERHGIKRVLVVREERLVGLVSRADLLRMLLPALEPETPACGSDEEIRDRLLRSLEKEGWVTREGLQVSCKDGVVTLKGTIFDERQAQALRVAAEAIPGVRRVEDHLLWVDLVANIMVAPEQTR